MALDEKDIRQLGRCVELARTALAAGDEPFGSILVDGDGRIPFEDHNHVAAGDQQVAPHVTVDGPAGEYRNEMMARYAAKFAP